MIRVNDIIALQNSKHVQCLIGTKVFKGTMATREDRDRLDAVHHLNVAIDKLKLAVQHGDEKAEKLLGGLWFHRVLNRGGVRC